MFKLQCTSLLEQAVEQYHHLLLRHIRCSHEMFQIAFERLTLSTLLLYIPPSHQTPLSRSTSTQSLGFTNVSQLTRNHTLPTTHPETMIAPVAWETVMLLIIFLRRL